MEGYTDIDRIKERRGQEGRQYNSRGRGMEERKGKEKEKDERRGGEAGKYYS